MIDISSVMVKFLYDVFVYNFALGKTSIKFEKIKNLLRDDNEQVNLSPFYELTRMGLIDKTECNSYILTPSKIFSNPNTNLSIGINLPISYLEVYKEVVIHQYLGLTIFKTSHWINSPYLIEFNLLHYTQHFQSLKNMIKKWTSVEKQYCADFRSLEKFDPSHKNWKKVRNLEEDTALYKRYIYNEFYFEYVLFYSNKYYIIKRYENEKVLFTQLSLSKQLLFTYEKNSQTLTLKKGILLPNYIYKTLFITHVLNNGEFPNNSQFKIDIKQKKQILTSLKLLFDLI